MFRLCNTFTIMKIIHYSKLSSHSFITRAMLICFISSVREGFLTVKVCSCLNWGPSPCLLKTSWCLRRRWRSLNNEHSHTTALQKSTNLRCQLSFFNSFPSVWILQDCLRVMGSCCSGVCCSASEAESAFWVTQSATHTHSPRTVRTNIPERQYKYLLTLWMCVIRIVRNAALHGKDYSGGLCAYINPEWCTNSVLVLVPITGVSLWLVDADYFIFQGNSPLSL